MTKRNLILHFVILAFSYGMSAKADDAPTVDFARDIVPLFAKNCTACHNEKNAEGGLRLESHKALMSGGDSGDAVVAKQVEESAILARVTGSDEIMPPEDNTVGAKRLTAKEIEMLRAWISSGALNSESIPESPIKWQPLPSNLKPVYALANSADGQFSVFGQGNTAVVTSQSGDNLIVQQLLDPSLAKRDSLLGVATHLDLVQSIAFSPDSQRIATGGFRTTKIWRRATHAEEVLSGLATPTGNTCISPDAARVAYTTSAHAFEIVDIDSGQAHRFLRTHSNPISSLVWLDDGARLLSCDQNGVWIVTNASTYKSREVSIDRPATAVAMVRAQPNRILCLGTDGDVFDVTISRNEDSDLYEATVRSIEGLADVRALTATPGSQPQIVIAFADGRVQIRKLDSSETINEFETGGPVRSVTASTDASVILTIPDQGAAKLWQSEDGRLIAELNRGHISTHRVSTAQRSSVRQRNKVDQMVKLIPDLKKVVEKEIEAQKKVQEFRDKSAEKLATQTKQVQSDGASVIAAEAALKQAVAAVEAAKKLIETKSAELDSSKKAAESSKSKRQSAEDELAKREQALATASDGVQRAQEELPKLDARISQEKAELTEMESHLAGLKAQPALALSPTASVFYADDDTVVVASENNSVHIFSTAGGTPLADLTASSKTIAFQIGDSGKLLGMATNGCFVSWDLRLPWQLERTVGSDTDSVLSDRVTALDFSPDGATLAIGSGPPSRFGDVKLVDVATGKITRDFGNVHSDTVLGVRFSPDGRMLATGGADRLCRLFDTSTGEMTRAFEGHAHHILSVAWHDDGQTLVTASADATIKTWNVDTGEQSRTIQGFPNEVTSVTYVGQTNQIVSSCSDGSVRMHDSANGKQIRIFAGANDALYAIGLSADEQRVTSGGQAGRVWTWQVADAKLLTKSP